MKYSTFQNIRARIEMALIDELIHGEARHYYCQEEIEGYLNKKYKNDNNFSKPKRYVTPIS